MGRCYSVEMDKHKILAEAKAELERHVWGTFVEGKHRLLQCRLATHMRDRATNERACRRGN